MNIEKFVNLLLPFFKLRFLLEWLKLIVGRNKKLIKTPNDNAISFN